MNMILSAILAATTVYRLELTDEKPFIVGADGVRREVVIIEPEYYAMLTGRVEQLWRKVNATESDRVGLHGPRVIQSVTNGVKRTVYRDGFRYDEKMLKSSRISPRQAEMRSRFNHWRDGKTKEVTVDHDATTGKDTVR